MHIKSNEGIDAPRPFQIGRLLLPPTPFDLFVVGVSGNGVVSFIIQIRCGQVLGALDGRRRGFFNIGSLGLFLLHLLVVDHEGG